MLVLNSTCNSTNYSSVGVAPPQTYAWSKLTRQVLENDILNTKVKDMMHYHHALVHKSCLRDLPAGTCSYERLEFLGDSIINCVIATYLCDKYPDKQEGYLTKIRNKIISGPTLASFASHLGLHRFLLMNDKALENSWNLNPRLMEDVFEALVGALYKDMGLLAAKTFILNTLERLVDFDALQMETNSKDALMRATQSCKIPLPVYHIVPTQNNKGFHVRAYVNGMFCGEAVSTCKKTGQQMAAKVALQNLGVDLTRMTIETKI